MTKAIKKPTDSWLLYILACSDGTLYTGITNDLDRRIAMHNSGTASRYTRARLPVTVVYTERCMDKSSALRKELRIKALTRQEKEAYVIRRTVKSRRTFLAAARSPRRKVLKK
jgi:predicted GIY-YIG superfamily endonuclease